jgi:AcrR family transcriptional regulator
MGRADERGPIPKSLRREATRAALIAAAHTVAQRGGADPLDPAVVTAEVGTSRPLFDAHFPTRGDFVEAILVSIHEDVAPVCAASAPPTVAPCAEAAILAFFAGLSAPLDRHAALARCVIPASHLPGPLAVARSRRRARAVARIASMLPPTLERREERATFLMDAFLGVQLAWSKALGLESLTERVRRDLAWAIRGVGAALEPIPHPPTSINEEIP